MTDFHSIRLHGPWNATVLQCYNSLESSQAGASPLAAGSDGGSSFGANRRLKIPSDWADWLGVEFRGCVSYRRKFNLPTGLEPGQAVKIVIDEVDDQAAIFLNDRALGTWQSGDPPFRADVRELLLPHNELCINVEVRLDAQRGDRQSLAGGLIGSVRLEIW